MMNISISYVTFGFISSFIISLNLLSQNDVTVFNKWSGTWEGYYEVSGFKNKEIMENNWVLNKAYFRMDIQGNLVDEPEVKYYSTTYFTVDPEGKIVGWNFSDGGYEDFFQLKGNIKDNVVTLNGTNTNYTVKIVFEYKDGKILRRSELKKNGKDEKTLTETIFAKQK